MIWNILYDVDTAILSSRDISDDAQLWRNRHKPCSAPRTACTSAIRSSGDCLTILRDVCALLCTPTIVRTITPGDVSGRAGKGGGVRRSVKSGAVLGRLPDVRVVASAAHKSQEMFLEVIVLLILRIGERNRADIVVLVLAWKRAVSPNGRHHPGPWHLTPWELSPQLSSMNRARYDLESCKSYLQSTMNADVS